MALLDRPFRTDPVLGPPTVDADGNPIVVEVPAWYDNQGMTEASYQTGTVVNLSDGTQAVWTDNEDGTFTHEPVEAEGGGGGG